MKKLSIGLLLAITQTAHAGGREASAPADPGTWYLQTSVYTRHFSPDPEHNNHQQLLGLEYHDASGWLLGGATFLNSFDQRAYYAYGGKRYDSADYPLYVKLTGGLLEGYHSKYQNKIPLNRYGVAPVVIPSLGTYYGPVSAELVLLGFNAAMITTGVRF